MNDILGVIDSDGDGEISMEEFLTGVGMMKRTMLQAAELNTLFDGINQKANTALGGGGAGGGAAAGSDSSSQHTIDAADLEKLLGVTREQADEMIFLGDTGGHVSASSSALTSGGETGNGGAPPARADERTIDSNEFRQLVMAWS